MDYRVLTEAERKYTFSQSQQLSMQTGLIGYLRADFGSTGKEFYSTWNDFRKDLKTDDFKKEFDLVINSYRFGDGEFLSGRSTMSKFCYEHPESSYEDDRNQYGVRVDTERYSYLMRFKSQPWRVQSVLLLLSERVAEQPLEKCRAWYPIY